MRLLVVTGTPTLTQNGTYCAYAPYVKEMDIWFKHSEKVIIISPTKYTGNLLVSKFKSPPKVVSVPSLNFSSLSYTFKSVLSLPIIGYNLLKEIYLADHIHLRCPGNIGLLGCLVQICFPKKTKTAKYAGNWDPKAKQPLSYRIQKWILSNTLLTKNMTVLAYGNWPNQTKNIKPFFTATFRKNEIEPVEIRNYSETIKFVFVGTLVEGKRPLLAIQIVEKLIEKRKNLHLDIYGNGTLRPQLEQYVQDNNLHNVVRFYGNQEKETVKKVLKSSHFLLLPSKSEGWPKAVAEAMFFGTIPIATKVSCIPGMLGFGKRGILINPNLEEAITEIERHLDSVEKLEQISQDAANWSRKYTLDEFETEIEKLLKP